jgi:arylsulfatase A
MRTLRLVLALLALGSPAAAGDPQRPNVVVILADDVGWRDVGHAGSRYPTPAIDRLASEGLTFTRAYAAAPSCSPTRAALLTGRHPARLGLTHAIRNRDYLLAREPAPVRPQPRRKYLVTPSATHLPEDAPTIAARLEAAGYATGFVGKWHLGEPPHGPGAHGFGWARDVGFYSASPYFQPWMVANPGEGQETYLTDRITADAVEFLRENRERPFFLWVSHFAVHGPWEAKPEEIARLEGLVDADSDQPSALYGAMLASLDQSVGAITEEIDRLGLGERTLVLFTSDNGPRLEKNEPLTSTAPLRGGKEELYEGGLRIPLVARWPGTISAGGSTAFPWVSMDLYPTVLELTGLERAASEAPDGLDLTRILRGESAPAEPRTLLFHVPHPPHRSALLIGDTKLVHRYDGPDELFDLATDPGEAHDLAGERTEDVRALREALLRRLAAMGARMPVPNPGYDPSLAPVDRDSGEDDED